MAEESPNQSLAEEVLALPSFMQYFPITDKETGSLQGASRAALCASVLQSRRGMLEEVSRAGLRLRLVPRDAQLQDLYLLRKGHRRLAPLDVRALRRPQVDVAEESPSSPGSGGSSPSTLLCLVSQYELGEDSIALAAVRQNGLSVQYAVEELRRHPRIMQEALLQNSAALGLRSEACPFVVFNACFFRGILKPAEWALLSPEEQEARFLVHVASRDFEKRLGHVARQILCHVNGGPWRPLAPSEREHIRRSLYNALGLTLQFFHMAPTAVKVQKSFLPALIENDLKCLLSFRRACSQKQLASGVRMPFEEVMTNEELRQITTNDFWRPLRMLHELCSDITSIANDALCSMCGDEVELMRAVSTAGLKRVDPFEALLINEDMFDNMMDVDFADMFACCEANLRWLVWLVRRALKAGGRPKYYTYTHILEASRQTAITSACIFLWIFSLSFVSGIVLFLIATHWSSGVG